MDIHRKLRELVNKGDSTQVTRILTEHEVDVNARSPVDGSTLLVQCVQAARPLTLSPATAPGDTGPGDHMATCRTLAFHGADLNLLDMLGKSALHWAVVYRDSGMVTQLLDLGADPRVPDRDGHPALHVAIKENTIDCAIVLVKLGSSEVSISSVFVLLIGISMIIGQNNNCVVFFSHYMIELEVPWYIYIYIQGWKLTKI